MKRSWDLPLLPMDLGDDGGVQRLMMMKREEKKNLLLEKQSCQKLHLKNVDGGFGCCCFDVGESEDDEKENL